MITPSTDTLVTIFKVSQIPLIPIISFMCFKAIKVIKRRELFWIGVAFIFNFLYLICTILRDTVLNIHLKHFEFSKIHGLGRGEHLMDFLTFVCFYAAMLRWFYGLKLKNIGIKNIRHALKHELISRKRIFTIIFTIVCLGILFLIAFDPGNYMLEISTDIFNFFALSLVGIFFFRWSDKFYGKFQLFLGFQIWGITQTLTLIFPHVAYDQIEAIGFCISLFAKIAILLGIFFWYVEFAIVTERLLSDERNEKETFSKSSKFFQDILRRTFHEIIIPMKSLGKSIDKLSEYKLSKFNNEYVELDCNYERVKTIITVSINAYNSPNQFSDDFLEALPIDEKVRIVNLNYLIEIAIRQIKNAYKSIFFTPLYSKGCYVECNQAQIIQVFTNLFKNAIEAYESDDKKQIVVRCYSTKGRGSNDDEKYVIVEVEDYGSGILPEYIDKIWDLDFTTKDKDDKNIVRGQGLSVVKDFLSYHSTTAIEVESPIKVKDGHNAKTIKGTKFKLTFVKRVLPNEKDE